MYLCPVCNAAYEEPGAFCANCGSPMNQPVSPAPQPTIQQQTQYYQAPYTGYQTAQPQVSMGKIIPGMILSIVGTVISLICLLSSTSVVADDFSAGFGMAFGYSFLSVPACIVGLLLSVSSIKQGSDSNMCKAGKILGMAGLGVCATAFILTTIIYISTWGF